MYRLLGIRNCNAEQAGNVPLLALSKGLSRATKPPLRDDNRPVHPMLFDSSLSCATAPDHLLNGLTKNVLTVVFSHLPKTRRRPIETDMLDIARINDLPLTGSILRWGSDGAYGGILSQTMSTFTCILLCASVRFSIEYEETEDVVYRLP